MEDILWLSYFYYTFLFDCIQLSHEQRFKTLLTFHYTN